MNDGRVLLIPRTRPLDPPHLQGMGRGTGIELTASLLIGCIFAGFFSFFSVSVKWLGKSGQKATVAKRTSLGRCCKAAVRKG